MKIVDVKRIRPHGGSLRIYTKKDSPYHNVSKNVTDLLNYELDNIDSNYILKKLEYFKIEIKRLKEELIKFKNNNINIVGYGAPARLATITNYADIDKSFIKFIIDDNNIKAGRFSPGKHIPIKKYSRSLDLENVILFAYEYHDSIKTKINDNKIKFYKPIPFKKLS